MKLITFYALIFTFWSCFSISFMTAKIVETSLDALRAVYTSKIQNRKSNYMGVFLTFTDRDKSKICEDMLKPYFWPISDIDGGDSLSFPLDVVRLRIGGLRLRLGSAIIFTCRGLDLSQNTIEVTISYGYSRNTFLVSAKTRRVASVHSFVIGTATYVIQPIADLEQFYFDSRFQIEKLGLESSEYINLVETRSDISSLSSLQKLLLCTGVFESPYYEWRKVTFKNNRSLLKIEYISVPLFFKKEKLKLEPFNISVMVCPVHLLGDKKQIFGLTQSYNHDNSLFVVTGLADAMFLDAYIKNVIDLDE